MGRPLFCAAGAPRDGRTVRTAGTYDRPERAQTAQDGRGQAGRYIYPLEGLNALTGLVGAHRDMQPRGRRGVGRAVPGMRAAVHPLEAAGCGYGAVGLCEALRGAFTLWEV